MPKIRAIFMYDNHARCAIECESLQELRNDLTECFKEDSLGMWGKLRIDGEPVKAMQGGFRDLTPLDALIA